MYILNPKSIKLKDYTNIHNLYGKINYFNVYNPDDFWEN